MQLIETLLSPKDNTSHKSLIIWSYSEGPAVPEIYNVV